VIKLNVVIVEDSQCRQPHTTLCPIFFSWCKLLT